MLRMTTISVQYCFNTARERKCISPTTLPPLMRIYRQGSHNAHASGRSAAGSFSSSCESKPANLLSASKHECIDSDWVSLLRQVFGPTMCAKVPVHLHSKGRGLQLRFTPSPSCCSSLRTATPGPLLQYIDEVRNPN